MVDVSLEDLLLNALEVGCGDPPIKPHRPALPHDENLLFTVVSYSLPDHLLDKEKILCDF